ncbi:hypothetical protein R6Q59_012561 [Mikania micrantha]
MKTHGSSAGLTPMSQSLDETRTREFETMLMDEDDGGQKKRRLSLDQVKALEKYFESENKLDPERKMKLAQELGLQPRQVAVWFQNRRARWKTKQLERDYGVLKASFDSLKHNYDSLKHDNDSLIKQIRELKSKLYEEDDAPVKEQSHDDKPKSPENMVETAYFKDGSSDTDSSGILNEQLTDSRDVYEPQFVKDEEHDFFSGDESCNFFSDDQAPTLQWY